MTKPNPFREQGSLADRQQSIWYRKRLDGEDPTKIDRAKLTAEKAKRKIGKTERWRRKKT